MGISMVVDEDTKVSELWRLQGFEIKIKHEMFLWVLF